MNQITLNAMTLAQKFHQGQYRDDSNDPYIVHPERVYIILQKLFPNDHVLLAAAWGHDLIEDTNIPQHIIERECGKAVLDLILEVTNPSKNFKHLKRYERKLMDQEHIKNGSLKAKILKLADRTDNLIDAFNTSKDMGWLKLYLTESTRLYEEALKGTHTVLEVQLLNALNDVKYKLENEK